MRLRALASLAALLRDEVPAAADGFAPRLGTTISGAGTLRGSRGRSRSSTRTTSASRCWSGSTPTGRPLDWAPALAELLAGAADAATLAALLPRLAAFAETSPAGSRPPRRRPACRTLATWLAAGDGVSPLASQLPGLPGWLQAAPLRSAHDDQPRDPDADRGHRRPARRVGRRRRRSRRAAARPAVGRPRCVDRPARRRRAGTPRRRALRPPRWRRPGGRHGRRAPLHRRPRRRRHGRGGARGADRHAGPADRRTDGPRARRPRGPLDRRRRARASPPVRSPRRSRGIVTLGTPHAGEPPLPLVDPALADAVRRRASRWAPCRPT